MNPIRCITITFCWEKNTNYILCKLQGYSWGR